MKTSIHKKTGSAVLASVLFASALFAVFSPISSNTAESVNALAEETSGTTQIDKAELTDGKFGFTNGGYIPLIEEVDEEGNADFNQMAFVLEANDPALKNFFDENYDRATFTFTLYRKNKGTNASATAIREEIFDIARSDNATHMAHFQRVLNDSNTTDNANQMFFQTSDLGTFGFGPFRDMDEYYSESKLEELGLTQTSGAGLTYGRVKSDLDSELYLKEMGIERGDDLEVGFKFGDTDENGTADVRVAIMVAAPSTEYYVDFSYNFEDFKEKKAVWNWSKFWFEDKIIYNSTSGRVSSVDRSVLGILNKMEEVGDLEYYFSEEVYAAAKNLMQSTLTQTITVEYLKQIEDTPFAELKTARGNVPVYYSDGKKGIRVDDIQSHLNIDTLNCLGSTVERIDCIDSESNLFKVIYGETICLKSETASDKDLVYFLDLNRSYEDFFKPLYEDGIFSEEVYSYFLNEIKRDYPQVDEWAKGEVLLNADKLYGYFGYAVIPEAATWDQFMKDVFDGKTDFKGVVYSFGVEENLSYSSYDKLLNEYGYNWLARAWSAIVDFVEGSEHEAMHYLLYADPDARQAGISDTGDADPDNDNGAGENIVEDKLEKGKSDWEKFLEWLEKNEKNILIIFGVTLVAGVVAFVTVRAIQTKPTKGKRKTKAKTKKK